MIGPTYRFPEQCCVCLKAPETTYTLSRSQTAGAQTTTYSLQVPICRSCLARQKRTEIWTAVVLAGFGGFIGLAIGLDKHDLGAIGGILIGGFLGLMVYYFTYNYFLQPAQIGKDGSGLIFRNIQYDKLFREKNNFSPRTYN